MNPIVITSIESLTAADKLRDFLAQIDYGDSPSSPFDQSTSPKSSSDTRSFNELYLLVQTADEISSHLKEENTVLRDNNTKLRTNVVTLIEENNRLHEEIRSTFVTDMLRLISIDDGQQITDKESQIVDLYSKQMRRLEIELKEMKEKLNMYEAIWHAPNDLMNCLICGALLPFNSQVSEHNGKFADIITENEANKRRLQQIQVKLAQIESKEQKTMVKFQESLHIVEQNQFDKAEAIVERDQLKIELVETQMRLKTLINEMDDRIINAKQNVEIICQQRLTENAVQIERMEEKYAQYELTIDRLVRENSSIAADFDVWKECLQRQEIDLSHTADSVKLQIQKAMRERDQANRNTMQIRSDFEKLLLQSNQDFLQLRHQLGSTQNCLNDIESELLRSKKLSLDLTEEINRLTRENIMLKSVKQTLERSGEENIDAIVTILKKREDDYGITMENLELERHQSLAYLEELVSKQNKLLSKLRLHSRQLTEEIVIIHEQKYASLQEMTIENQELRMKLSNVYERLDQTNTQLVQHRDIHVKLKERVIQLNNQVKEHEHIISKSKAQDSIDYGQKFVLMSQRN